MTRSGIDRESDSDSRFDGGWRPSDYPCSKCQQMTLRFRILVSLTGSYRDANYQCSSCGHSWWFESVEK